MGVYFADTGIVFEIRAENSPILEPEAAPSFPKAEGKRWLACPLPFPVGFGEGRSPFDFKNRRLPAPILNPAVFNDAFYSILAPPSLGGVRGGSGPPLPSESRWIKAFSGPDPGGNTFVVVLWL